MSIPSMHVIYPPHVLLLHDSWLCFTALQSVLRSLQTKRAPSGVVVAPWDDEGWRAYRWGHLVYRAELQSISLLLLHSLAWKIKQKKNHKKKVKKPPVCLARDYSDSSDAVLRLPILALGGIHVWLHQGVWKTRVYWCWKEQTSKTQRTPWWKRLI